MVHHQLKTIAATRRVVMSFVLSSALSLAGNEYIFPQASAQEIQPTNTILRDHSGINNYFLTFDGHDDNTHVQYVLDTLRKNNIKATFFLTGKFITDFPNDTKLIVAEGHTVGNHTLTHDYYSDANRLIYELKETERLFFECTGKLMAKIWRAPYLQHINNPKLLLVARSIGYVHIDVSLCTIDWVDQNDPEYIENILFLNMFNKGFRFPKNDRIQLSKSTCARYQNAKEFNYSGVIMLMHVRHYRDSSEDFVLTLDSIIKSLQQNNYTFEECSKLIN